MSSQTRSGRVDVRGAFFVGLLVAASCCAGLLIRTPSVAHGDVRRVTPQTHFQSGAAHSEPVLREISATLKRMDARLAKIEKAALDAVNKPAPAER